MSANHPFVGRENILEEIKDKWKQCRLFGISGTRSVGKSRLVEELLLEQRRKYNGYNRNLDSVIVDLRNSSSLKRIFNKLFEKLNVENVVIDEDEMLSEICDKLVKIPDFVIVFDNAEDVIDKDELRVQLFRLCCTIMQTCPGVKIIITSTTKTAFSEMDLPFNDAIYELQLHPLSRIESEILLRVIAPSVEFGICLDNIVDLCEGLPLAILMAASELADETTSVVTPLDMVQLLTESRLEALSGEFYPKKDQIAPVYFKFLERLSAHDKASLAVLGYIPGSFNEQQATEILYDSLEDNITQKMLMTITRRHVAQFDPMNRRYDIHGILRDCISVFYKIENLAEVRKRFCFIFSAILREISSKMDTNMYMDALTTFNVEHQNFQKLLTDVIHSTEDTYHVFIDLACNATGAIQNFMGREGFQFYKECIKLSQQNKMEKDEAFVRVSYGSALTNIQNDLKSGEENYKLAIKVIGSLCLNDCMYQLALVHQRLGWNLGCQGRVEEALKILEKALELEDKLNLKYDTLILQTLNSLGIFHAFADNFKESEKYHYEALKRRTYLYGTEMHPFIGSCYSNLGLLFRRAGNIHQAVECFQKGLNIKIQTKASGHAIALSENHVAMSLAHLDKHKEALETIDTAYERLSKFPGLYAEGVAFTLDTKGQILLLQKRFPESVSCLTQAVQMRRKLVPGNVSLVESLVRLSQALVRMNRFTDAIDHIKEAMELKHAAIEMPTNTFVIEGYEACLEANFALRDTDGLKQSFKGASDEVNRLIHIYEDFGNKLKVDYFRNKLTELSEKYQVVR